MLTTNFVGDAMPAAYPFATRSPRAAWSAAGRHGAPFTYASAAAGAEAAEAAEADGGRERDHW